MQSHLFTNSFLAKRLFLKYLVPSILSLLASSVNSLIDTAIVGNCVGDAGLQCMSIVAPVHLLYLTVGSTLCVGSSVCFSQALGENDVKKAKFFFGFAIVSVFSVGILFTALFTPLSSQIACLLGANDMLVQPCTDYLFYYFLGGTFVMTMYIPHSFSKALGKPSTPLILLAVMAVINVALTYLFVAILNMGIGGASLATVIAIAAASLLGFFFVISPKSAFNPTFFKLKFKECVRAAMSGIASGFNNFIRFLTIFGVNTIITAFLSVSLLSTYSVARSVQDMFLCVALGTSQAIIPIIAMFYSERDNRSVKTVVKTAVIVGLVLVVLCVGLALFFGGDFSRLFGKSPAKGDEKAIFFMVLSLIPALLNCLAASYYTCVKKYGFSYLILALRVLFTLVFALAFATGVGADALFFCFFCGELCAFAFAMLAVTVYASKRKNLNAVFLLEKKNDNPADKLSFSLSAVQEKVVEASAKLSDFLEERNVEMKSAMKSSLAVEEILMAIINRKILPPEEYVYVNVFYDVDGVVMRFRYGGKQLNPFGASNEMNEDDENFGLIVLRKSVKEIEYMWSFGLNNLVVLI